MKKYKNLIIALVFILLPIALYFIYRIFWPTGANFYQPWGISVCIMLYGLAGYLLTKESGSLVWGGILTFLTTVVAACLIAFIPIQSWPTLAFNLLGSIFTFGMGIFLISRKSCFFRGWGVFIILATLAIGLVSGLVTLGSFVQEKEVTDQNKQKIISETGPMIDEFFVAWNERDYETFVKNLSDTPKQGMTKTKFAQETSAQFGNFVSKENPKVYKMSFIYEVDYTVNFTKRKNMLIHFQVNNITGKYQISGFNLEPAEGSKIHQK